MNKFMTLIRRDIADNRGALIITPLVIAALVLLLGVISTLVGKAQFGIDPNQFKGEFSIGTSNDEGGEQRVTRDSQGRVIITSPQGTRTLNDTIGEKGKAAIATIMPLGTAVVGVMPIGVAAIIVLFLLSGCLYDERKDRTILFWKSMPVSDLATASAKMVSIIGIGFAIALGVGMVMQLGSVMLATLSLSQVGVSGIPLAAVLTNVGLLWLVALVALVTYIGWAMPVYAWFLAVSAAAPKAPFIAAILPLALAPAIAGILNLPGDIHLWLMPLRRLVGAQAFQNVTDTSFRNLDAAQKGLPIQETITEITSSMTSPYFWVGLAVAAALIFVASEIRRRRAL